MNTKQNNTTAKAIAMGAIVGGVALTSLAATGCDGLTAEKIAALSSVSVDATVYQFGPEQKSAPGSKIVNNHNETFLAGA